MVPKLQTSTLEGMEEKIMRWKCFLLVGVFFSMGCSGGEVSQSLSGVAPVGTPATKPSVIEEVITEPAVTVPQESVTVQKISPDQNVTVEPVAMTDETMSELREAVSDVYPQKILSKPVRVQADAFSGEGEIKIAMKVPDDLLEKYGIDDLSLHVIEENSLHQETSPSTGGPEEIWLRELKTERNENVLEAYIHSAQAQDIKVVIGTTGWFNTGKNMLTIYHDIDKSGKEKELARLIFYHEPSEEYKTLFKHYITRIIDFYRDRVGVDMSLIHFPIEIHLVKLIRPSVGGSVSIDTGLMQISYDEQTENDRVPLLQEAIIPSDKLEDLLPFVPHKFAVTLAHEMWHYFSFFYTAPQSKWAPRYRPLEEGAAMFFENILFNLDDNWQNVKSSAFDNAYLNTAPYSIKHSENCFPFCSLEETARIAALHKDNLHETVFMVQNKGAMQYGFYARLFRWATSLDKDFTLKFYQAIGASTQRRRKNGPGFYRTGIPNTKSRELFMEMLQEILAHAPSSLPQEIQKRIEKESTALFAFPDFPFMEFYVNYLLLYHHPGNTDHPTNYYPFFPDLMDSEIRDDLFRTDDFISKDRHRTNASLYTGENINSYENVYFSRGGTWRMSFTANAELAKIGEDWEILDANNTTPSRPATARLIRLYVEPTLRGKGKAEIRFDQKEGKPDGLSYIVFREEDPDSPLIYVEGGALKPSLTVFHEPPILELELDCSDKKCPVYFVLVVNNNIDYTVYDGSWNARSLYDVKNNDDIASDYLPNLPQIETSVRMEFEETPSQVLRIYPESGTIACEDSFMGVALIEFDSPIFERFPDYSTSEIFLKEEFHQSFSSFSMSHFAPSANQNVSIHSSAIIGNAFVMWIDSGTDYRVDLGWRRQVHDELLESKDLGNFDFHSELNFRCDEWGFSSYAQSTGCVDTSSICSPSPHAKIIYAPLDGRNDITREELKIYTDEAGALAPITVTFTTNVSNENVWLNLGPARLGYHYRDERGRDRYKRIEKEARPHIPGQTIIPPGIHYTFEDVAWYPDTEYIFFIEGGHFFYQKRWGIWRSVGECVHDDPAETDCQRVELQPRRITFRTAPEGQF